jgi:hypothetical protein
MARTKKLVKIGAVELIETSRKVGAYIPFY